MTEFLKSGSVNIGKRILYIFFAGLIIGLGFYFWQSFNIGIDFSCIETREYKITGRSMEPLLAEGALVEGLLGYYNCNETKRGQIVILEFNTREEDFVKKIRGVPGDELIFESNRLRLNGEILKNSQGQPYLFSGAIQKIINVSLKEFILSENNYLVLGEEKDSSAFDSRKFGLVKKERLIGRVIK